MIRNLLMVLALAAPTAAVAEGQIDFGGDAATTENFSHSFCRDFDYNPDSCNQYSRECLYDYIDSACYPRGGGGGGGGGNRSCSSYNRDPSLCNDQPNCNFNYQWNVCEDTWQQPGGRCSRYDGDQWTCDRDPSCRFDSWSQRCEQRGGGGGGNQIRTTQLSCSSSQYRYAHCTIPGQPYAQIVDAYLTQTYSNADCQQNYSWGYDQSGVWVDRGCSASFQVRYRSQY